MERTRFDDEQEEDLISEYDSLRTWARTYRNNSEFDKALEGHLAALEVCRELKDTIKIAAMYNELGTDMRRIGNLDLATNYHFQALKLTQSYYDTLSFNAQRNIINAYNGIGNIYLSIGNELEAERMFRRALSGEQVLGNDLGQAINYANIGSLVERRGDLDSALVLYNLALEYDRKANSTLGVGLCYNYIGRVYEQQGRTAQALEQYLSSYEVLLPTGDIWHYLEPCISIAELYISQNNCSSALPYIKISLESALSINSYDHLSRAYSLMSAYYEHIGNYQKALEYYKEASSAQNQFLSEREKSSIESVQVEYEQQLQVQRLENVQKELLIQKKTKLWITKIAVIAIAILAFVIVSLILGVRLRQKTVKKLEDLDNIRTGFFTNITHEFRTPLTVILGVCQEQKSKISDQRYKSDLDSVISQGNSLLDLVNQLLDVSRVRSSIGEADFRRGDVSILIKQVVENMSVYANQNKVGINYSDDIPKEGLSVDFVPDYIKKSLDNLLSNAIKYSPEWSSIQVSLTCNETSYMITVTDSGVGIAKEDIPYIFDPFFMGKRKSKVVGTGVGLTMVKQMCLSMGGTVSARNVEGKGASFVMTLPLRHSGEDIPAFVPVSIQRFEDNSEIESITFDDNAPIILVVEDNKDIAHFIGSVLASKYNVIYAKDGMEAYRITEESIPDIIVTDLMMPVMGGYELIDKVRQNIATNHIPVIVLSAKCTEQDRLESFKRGADGFIAKPFNTDELRMVISNILDRKHSNQKIYTDAIISGENLEVKEIPAADKEFLSRLDQIITSNLDDTDLNSEKIAGEMCLSQRQLNRKVKALTGTDTQSFIRGKRLSYARELLLSTEDSIGEIVSRCGFDSPSYFSKMYKIQFGETPSKTRKG